MPTRYVTCPETAHLERIEYDEHPYGLLVYACSRFHPACAVDCPRTCASRLDRKREHDEEVALTVGDDTGVHQIASLGETPISTP